MMFIQDPDDWMMTWGGHWSADTGTSGVQRDPGDIQCREHFRYLQPVWQLDGRGSLKRNCSCTDKTYLPSCVTAKTLRDTNRYLPQMLTWKNRIVAIMDFLQLFLSACFKKVLTAYHLAKTECCKAPFISTHIFLWRVARIKQNTLDTHAGAVLRSTKSE